MTDKATLLALAERVEAAEAGSFTLDKEILAALGYTWRGMGYWYHDNSRQWMGSARLTASLDAAKTLVPEGDSFTVGQNAHHGHWVASVNYLNGDGVPQSRGCSNACRTGPLALTAAALRALAETLP